MSQLSPEDLAHGIEAEDLAIAGLAEFLDTVDNYPELRRNPVLLGLLDHLMDELEVPFYKFGRGPKKRDVTRRRREIILKRDEYRCRACGEGNNLEIDHIFPISRGGTNAVENLQTLCKSCNMKKGTEYYGWDLPE